MYVFIKLILFAVLLSLLFKFNQRIQKMNILLFSTNDETNLLLKYCFPTASVEIAYIFDDFRRPLTHRRYDLVCYGEWIAIILNEIKLNLW